MDRPHWIVRDGREYGLFVEERDREVATVALAQFEREESTRVKVVETEPLNIPVFAVIMTVLVLIQLFAVQTAIPAEWASQGVADDLRIRLGEWWRTCTALTLHGDLDHLVSNLSLGVFVCAFVYSRFGVGIGFLGTVLGGAVGNALNVWVHWYQPHRSIGSSTALFAGLGLLAGAELAARLRHQDTRGLWSLIVPLGAGMTFLSLFGGAGFNRDGVPVLDAGQVDVMAHLLGLVAGVVLGASLFAIGARRGAPSWAQLSAGIAAMALLTIAWLLALQASIR
jgi:membrane associated rhomboid family serine protease